MLHSLEAATLLELAVELLKVCCGKPVQRDLADFRDDVPVDAVLVVRLCLCSNRRLASVYKGNIIKNLIMDCQSYTKYRPNETTGGIFVSWRRKEELPTGA